MNIQTSFNELVKQLTGRGEAETKAIVISPEKAQALLKNTQSDIKVQADLAFDKSMLVNKGVKLEDLKVIPEQKAGAPKKKEAGGIASWILGTTPNKQ